MRHGSAGPTASTSTRSEVPCASSEVALRLPSDAALVCLETSRGRLRAYGVASGAVAAEAAETERAAAPTARPLPLRPRSSSASFVVREERLGAHVHVLNALASFLLPAGFPDSVAPEYSRYMFWRGVQYFFGGALSVYTTRSLLGALDGGSKKKAKVAGDALQGPKVPAAPPGEPAPRSAAARSSPSPSSSRAAPPSRSLQKTQKAAHVVTRKVARSAARASSAVASNSELSKDAGAAAIRWALKDGAGRFGRFLFARWGRALDGELKRFRLAGDGLLELGAALELATALAPSWFLPLACTANVSKNLAAVAASATRAPIYAAFARCNNVADLAAKGESVANLADVVGTGVGIALARAGVPTLPAFGLLSVGYLVASRKEVDAVVLPGFNRARLALAAQDALRGCEVPTPVQAAEREPIVFDPASRRVVIGARVQDAFKDATSLRAAIQVRRRGGKDAGGAGGEGGAGFTELPPYLVSYRPDHRRAYVVLSERATQRDALAGALEAHALAEAMDAICKPEKADQLGTEKPTSPPSLLSVSKPIDDIVAFEADLQKAAQGKPSVGGGGAAKRGSRLVATLASPLRAFVPRNKRNVQRAPPAVAVGDCSGTVGSPSNLTASPACVQAHAPPTAPNATSSASPSEALASGAHERALEYLARNGPRLHRAFFEAATEAGWKLQQTTLGALDTRIVSA